MNPNTLAQRILFPTSQLHPGRALPDAAAEKQQEPTVHESTSGVREKGETPLIHANGSSRGSTWAGWLRNMLPWKQQSPKKPLPKLPPEVMVNIANRLIDPDDPKGSAKNLTNLHLLDKHTHEVLRKHGLNINLTPHHPSYDAYQALWHEHASELMKPAKQYLGADLGRVKLLHKGVRFLQPAQRQEWLDKIEEGLANYDSSARNSEYDLEYLGGRRESKRFTGSRGQTSDRSELRRLGGLGPFLEWYDPSDKERVTRLLLRLHPEDLHLALSHLAPHLQSLSSDQLSRLFDEYSKGEIKKACVVMAHVMNKLGKTQQEALFAHVLSDPELRELACKTFDIQSKAQQERTLNALAESPNPAYAAFFQDAHNWRRTLPESVTARLTEIFGARDKNTVSAARVHAGLRRAPAQRTADAVNRPADDIWFR